MFPMAKYIVFTKDRIVETNDYPTPWDMLEGLYYYSPTSDLPYRWSKHHIAGWEFVPDIAVPAEYRAMVLLLT